MEMISCKKLYEETGMDTYVNMLSELTFFEAFLRHRGIAREDIGRAKDDYEKILKRLSITLHEETRE